MITLRRNAKDLGPVSVAGVVALLAAMTLVPLGVLTYVAITRSETAVQREVDSRLQGTVRASAMAVEAQMRSLGRLVESYARRPTVIAALGDGSTSPDTAALRRHLAELQAADPSIALAFVADPSGTYIDGVPDRPEAVGRNFSQRDWFRGVTQVNDIYISEAYQPSIPGRPVVVAAAVPIRATETGGNVVGILVASYSLDALERHTDPVAAPQGFRLTVTDQRGNVVAGPRRQRDRIVSMAGDPRVQEALAGGGGANTLTVNDQQVLSAHSPTATLGWSVIAEVPVEGALVPVSGLRGTLLALASLLTGATLLALLVTARTLGQRRAVLDELAAAHREALTASGLKSEFLATMSHEIRTPMNGIMGLLGVLSATDLSEDQRNLVETAETSAANLLGIINDILDFSRIEAGRLELEDGVVNVHRVLEQVTSLLAGDAEAKGLELSVNVHPDVPQTLRGDAGRLRQVLVNLVANAVKFTAQGSVRVMVTRDETSLRVEVSDTGIGMSQDTVARLFTSFTQADRSTTRVYGGSGLGLAISRRLVEVMGGEIGVDSEPARGSRFWFQIPLRDVTDQEATEAEAPTADRAMRVLVVDDEPTNRLMLAQSLAGWSMDVSLAESGREALELLRDAAAHKLPYDVVLVDHEMDGMNGIELANLIRNDPKLRGPQLILLSSSSRTIDPRAARQAGIATWLAKPVRASALYDAIHAELMRPAVAAATRFASNKAEPQAGFSRAGTEPRPLKLLIAEDNPVNQQVATRMLELRGFEVEVANDGRSAVDAFAINSYDAILMDCQMPGMDGFEATMAIRSLEAGRSRIPIIALTAGAMAGDREKSLAAGMDAHVTKPVAWDDAAQLIQNLVLGKPERAPEIASGSSPTLEHRSLDELREMGGVALVEELIETFVTSTEGRLDEAESAAAAQDRDRLTRICHGMRGAASSFGATELAAVINDLELSANHGDPTEWPLLLDRARAVFSAVQSEIVDYIVDSKRSVDAAGVA